MADVTENGLRAAVKALTDVVAPSIDPKDPLAREQLRLVVDYLEFVRARLDHLYARDRFELDHHLALAEALQGLAAPGSAQAARLLNASIEAGSRALSVVGTDTATLKAASAALAAAIRELIRASPGFDERVRTAIERRVLEASDAVVRFERAWYLPMGFDPRPGEVPALASLFPSTVSSGMRRAS